MSIFKREPRAVYRIYDEDEYLAGEPSDAPEPTSSPDPQDISSPYVDRHPVDDLYGAPLRRVVTVAVLVGVTMVVAVLTIAYAARREPRAPAVSSERPTRSARTPSSSNGSGPASHLSSLATMTRRSVRSASSSRRSRHLEGEKRHSTLARLRVQPQAPTMFVPMRHSSSWTASSSPSPARAQAEFGFER